MKRFLAVLLTLFAAVPVMAQGTAVRVERPIVHGLDLDTPTITATTNYIVTSVNLTNVALTLAHQPDTPRNLTGTVTDTTPSVVAGTVTFVGTDVNGAAQTEVWNFATALTFTGTKLFATVTTATVAGATVLGGLGDETIVVGVGSTVAYRYCALSDPKDGTGGRIKNTGSSTTWTAVSGTPFDLVAVGDELVASNVNGSQTTVITAKASGASITVADAVDISATGGFAWTYRTLNCGYGDSSGWVATRGLRDEVAIVVRQRTATGGIDYTIETRQRRALGKPMVLESGNLTGTTIVGIPASNTASAAIEIADVAAEARVGLKFGTTDDSSDSGVELIDVTMTTEEKR